MTDKQIIDGVDVSGCEFCDYDNYECPMCEQKRKRNELNIRCELRQNCYYKQLKRKEQEYEELRQYHNKCCEEFEKEKKEWLEKHNQISRGFYNGDYCNTEHCSLLQAKEQECEELKKIINEAKNSKLDLNSFFAIEAIVGEYQLELDQLKAENKELKEELEELKEENEYNEANAIEFKQTLTEIKEIAQGVRNYLQVPHPKDVRYEMDIILQKIREVE